MTNQERLAELVSWLSEHEGGIRFAPLPSAEVTSVIVSGVRNGVRTSTSQSWTDKEAAATRYAVAVEATLQAGDRLMAELGVPRVPVP